METKKHKTKELVTSGRERCYTVVGSLTARTAPPESLSLLPQNARGISLTLGLLAFFFVSQKTHTLYVCSHLVTRSFSLCVVLPFICLKVQRLYLYLNSQTHPHTHTHTHTYKRTNQKSYIHIHSVLVRNQTVTQEIGRR